MLILVYWVWDETHRLEYVASPDVRFELTFGFRDWAKPACTYLWKTDERR